MCKIPLSKPAAEYCDELLNSVEIVARYFQLLYFFLLTSFICHSSFSFPSVQCPEPGSGSVPTLNWPLLSQSSCFRALCERALLFLAVLSCLHSRMSGQVTFSKDWTIGKRSPPDHQCNPAVESADEICKLFVVSCKHLFDFLLSACPSPDIIWEMELSRRVARMWEVRNSQKT